MTENRFTLKISLLKLTTLSAILAILVYGLMFYVKNEDLIKNFKFSYATKVYIPSAFASIKYGENHYLAFVENFVSRFISSTIASPKNPINLVGSQTQAKSIPIIYYHGIVENESDVDTNIDEFRDQMFALKAAGYQTIKMQDFYDFVNGSKSLPEKSFLLTFDDGRKDSYYPVDPILKSLNYTAVMFVIAGSSLGPENQDSPYYLSEKELHRMIDSGRWELQSHGKNDHGVHDIDGLGTKGPFLTNKLWLEDKNRLETDDEYRQRITKDLFESKFDLENAFGHEVYAFAFPFGDYGQNQTNFADSQSILKQTVDSVFKLSFFQSWSSRPSRNYFGSHNHLARRMEMEPYWDSTDLLSLLEETEDKPLPFSDNFSKDSGWSGSWGSHSIENNDLVLYSTDKSSGASIFLDGTYTWDKYSFSSNLAFDSGTTFSLIAHYEDNSDFVRCNFNDSVISIDETINNITTRKQEWEGNFNSLIRSGEFVSSISVQPYLITCSINGQVMVSTSNPSESLKTGGIGFSVWDPILGQGKVTIKGVKISSLE